MTAERSDRAREAASLEGPYVCQEAGCKQRGRVQVVFGAKGEYVETHSLPLFGHHLGQVAEHHACTKPEELAHFSTLSTFFYFHATYVHMLSGIWRRPYLEVR